MEKKLFQTVTIDGTFKQHYFEEIAEQQGLLIAGIDEVGRGPGAGPVLAAAVVLHPCANHPLLKDSKTLTGNERDIAYAWLMTHSWHGWTAVSAQSIDAIGITEATKIAMERAFYVLCRSLPTMPAAVLVDAIPLCLTSTQPAYASHGTPMLRLKDTRQKNLAETLQDPWGKVIAFNYGETLSRTVAAASIMAKVQRDRIMTAIAPSFPIYGFERHKGYNTAFHKQAIHNHGISILHRRLWKSNIASKKESTILDEHEASMPVFHGIQEDSKENY